MVAVAPERILPPFATIVELSKVALEGLHEATDYAFVRLLPGFQQQVNVLCAVDDYVKLAALFLFSSDISDPSEASALTLLHIILC